MSHCMHFHLLSYWGIDLFVICMLDFMATLSRWPKRVGRRYRKWSTKQQQLPCEQGVWSLYVAPSLSSCVPNTKELYLPCYLTQSKLCGVWTTGPR